MVYEESLKFRTVKSATIVSKLGMRPVFDKSSKFQGPSWLWSHGSWIYNYLCNQCLSPLMLWVWILLRARCATLCDKDCQWLAAGQWFSPGTPVSSTNKTVRHDITKILLKVVLNTIKPTKISDCKGHPNNMCVWTCRQVLARAANKLM
jgi:hypothetical protein